jgi:hypothetical protein
LPGIGYLGFVVFKGEKMGEVDHLKERLQVYEHWAIMGKLITCATHELQSIVENTKHCLSLAQEKEKDPGAERQLTEALKYLHQMSLTINSLLACAKSASISWLDDKGAPVVHIDHVSDPDIG